MEGSEVDQKTLLRPSEASVRFQVPVKTIYIWYALGKIDGVTLNGRTLRIFSRSLRNLLNSRSHRKGMKRRAQPPGRRAR